MPKIEGKKGEKIQYLFWFLTRKWDLHFTGTKSSISTAVQTCAETVLRAFCRYQALFHEVCFAYFNSLRTCLLWPIIISSIENQAFSKKQQHHQKNLGKMKKFREKRFQRNQSDWLKKKERNESKVCVTSKKDCLKKLKYNNLTSQKEVFNCFVSRMRIFEVRVFKEFVKTLFFNVKL